MKEQTKASKDQVMTNDELDKVAGGTNKPNPPKANMIEERYIEDYRAPQSNGGVTNGGFVGR